MDWYKLVQVLAQVSVKGKNNRTVRWLIQQINHAFEAFPMPNQLMPCQNGHRVYVLGHQTYFHMQMSIADL